MQFHIGIDNRTNRCTELRMVAMDFPDERYISFLGDSIRNGKFPLKFTVTNCDGEELDLTIHGASRVKE